MVPFWSCSDLFALQKHFTFVITVMLSLPYLKANLWEFLGRTIAQSYNPPLLSDNQSDNPAALMVHSQIQKEKSVSQHCGAL